MRQSLIFRPEPFEFDLELPFGEMEAGSGSLVPAWLQTASETLEFEEYRSLMSDTPAPGSFYKIKYGQGGLLETAGRAYGLKAGAERLKGAQDINNHPLNRKFWRPPENAFERKYFKEGLISFNARFTCGGDQGLAGRGDKKCCARIWIPPAVTPADVSPRSFPSLFTVPMADTALNWSNIGAAEVHHLLWTFCKARQLPLPGEDDRFLVTDTDQPPYRWICKIFAVFLSGPQRAHIVTGEATGFLLDSGTLVTSAHVLYGFHPRHGIRVPDCLIVLPGLRHGLEFHGDMAPLAGGAFEIRRNGPGNKPAFFVPSEWISTYDPDQRSWLPEYDYAAIKLTGARTLIGGSPPSDSWSSISKMNASIAAEDEKEPEALARAVLASRGANLCTSGYPADQVCWPVSTRKFEFATLRLPVDADHNVMLTRTDVVGGTSGSPVWFERKRLLPAKGGSAPRRQVRKLQRQLMGIVEGGYEFESSSLVTYTTLITPKVLARLRHTPFISSL